MNVNRYTPYFSAKQRAADRWALPTDPCPKHERMMTALRRMPGGSDLGTEVRKEAARQRFDISQRDWRKWRRKVGQ